MHTQKEHRQRVKARFQEEGLDHFDPVHALELLLFYADPRGDTNPTAHALLNHFGSVRAIIDADINALIHVPGLGKSAAKKIYAHFHQ